MSDNTIRGTRYIKRNLVSNKFALTFNKIKEFSLNVQRVTMPGVSVENPTLVNPFIDRPVPGTKLMYENFPVEFIVDDELNSYKMVYDWMRSYAPVDNAFSETPESFPEFDSYRKNLPAVYDLKTEGNVIPEGSLVENATLIVNDSGNIPAVEFRFVDMFPSSLSGLPFDTTKDTDEILVCSAVFKFWYYTIHTKGEI